MNYIVIVYLKKQVYASHGSNPPYHTLSDVADASVSPFAAAEIKRCVFGGSGKIPTFFRAL